MRENVEEEAQTSTSKPGVVESTPGNKAVSGKENTTHDEPKSASSTHDDDDGEREASEIKPKQKPFGSKKNIHTLGCFQNESSRGVKKKSMDLKLKLTIIYTMCVILFYDS